jgi:type I restriction enzyme, S subunit
MNNKRKAEGGSRKAEGSRRKAESHPSSLILHPSEHPSSLLRHPSEHPSSFSLYPSYKDSGVEWIGETPASWDVLRIKRLTQVKRGASPRPIDDPKYFNDDNGEYAWVRIADVSASQRYLESTTQTLSELGASLSVKRHPGDLFVSIAGTVGKPIITKIKCCIHDGFVWFSGLDINNEFLYYIFITGELFKGLGKWGTQLNLNTETIGDIYISLPSKEEIECIVDFLDDKTGKIDRLISTKRRQIELLKEQRTAVINQAVTRGLDPDVELKDSGIEWLGKIPKHWGVKKLKYIIEPSGLIRGPFGSALKKEFFVIKGYKVYEQKNAIKNSLLIGDSYISDSKYKELKRFSVKENDLLMSCSGTIGKLVEIKGEYCPGVINQAMLIIRLNDIINRNFFKYMFKTEMIQSCILGSSYGSAIKNLIGIDAFKDIPFIVPEVSEQVIIADFLDKKMTEIDATISKAEKQIELLTEYRTALISEAVTGKIDVRDEVLRLKDEGGEMKEDVV